MEWGAIPEVTATQLYDAGYTDLVCVVPPGAALAPTSTLKADQLGKTPGRRLANGTWVGYNWRKHRPPRDEVRQWEQHGANIGLLADQYPALDIDCLDPVLSDEIAAIAEHFLGPAPVRVGQAPKQLLLYRTDEPFARMALLLHKGDQRHLIEVLGTGRQFLVEGMHPKTGRPYEWDIPLHEIPPMTLTRITSARVADFFDTLEGVFELFEDITIERIGDGRIRAETAGDQTALVAPSTDALRAAVDVVPNTDDFFPTREDYVRMGYAIRAACGDDEVAGFEVFASWAGRHPNDGRVSGNPATWKADWDRMRPPYAVGWSWIIEQARAFGYSDAAEDFEPLIDAPPAPALSDRWLADQVVAAHGDRIRYIPAAGKWHVWDGVSWVPDGLLQVDHLIGDVLRGAAEELIRTDAKAEKEARRLCSRHLRDDVMNLVRSDPRVAMPPEAFDADPWRLNTPAGILDLTTGGLTPHDADALCTKRTAIGPDFVGGAPLWTRFLAETAGGDEELIAYLRRLTGYCLTGSTREEMLAFFWGPGGNGKGVFLNTISAILRDYATPAGMDTFTASSSDRHPTELARLLGARLVTASETQSGRHWDEARIKSLTGRDTISARFMHKNFFTYTPQFKLLFMGNHRPEIRNLDDAMMRRMHLVPFVNKPEKVDTQLADKLKVEWGAILAWMVQGCLEWQRDGLNAPEAVRSATQEYFEEEDSFRIWIEDRCDITPGEHTSTQTLFDSWAEWANHRGVPRGSAKRVIQALVTHGFHKARYTQDGKTIRGIRDITIRDPFMETPS